MALYQRLQRQFLSRVWLARIILAILIIGISAGGYQYFFRPVFNQATRLWQAYSTELPSYQGRVNFLLLGIAGDSRDGNQLTDTIILVSVDKKSGDVALISVPRDIWVPSLRAKINTAYYYGELKKSGLQLVKSAVSEVIGLPIQFAGIIDFFSFEKMIDLLGGVDVVVDRGFVDRQYPIAGKENDTCDGDPHYSCRYETVQFNQGLVHMNGESALKFARSRHAAGDEGTDFARSVRQEKVIEAVRRKLITARIVTDRGLLIGLYNNLRLSVNNDIDNKYYLPLLRLGVKAWKRPLKSTSVGELFYNPPISRLYDFQWVLVPKKEESVASYVKDFLTIPIKD